jgi:coproporphyrinogen III oxidase
MDREPKKDSIIDFLRILREEIIAAFVALESTKNIHFDRRRWDHHTGGGGEMAVLRAETFEKAAVNWSAVWGDSFPMDDAMGPFFATGISLITHMRNPHAPTVHMNIRYIETKEKFWFGGGYDLTPMGFPYEEDRDHFHAVAEKNLNKHSSELYSQFSENASKYFYIPHRQRERGVGGIFFDHYNSGDWEKDFSMWKSVGSTFLEAILPIYKKRIAMPYEEKERLIQLQKRAHYAEFNLLYDRGTKFGFSSGGNPEAILCSMPPLVAW